MAIYQFGSISTAEAAAYNAATDDLQFTGISGATATNISITGAYTLRVISTGASVTLGFGAHEEVLTLSDGSRLAFPTDKRATVAGGSAGDHLYGGPDNDELSGFGGGDVLDGGTFPDVLIGGAGRDTLTGGGGIDTFVFAAGDSGVTEGQLDAITDWESNEKLAFTTDSGGYAEATASSYAAALQTANQQIAAGAADVIAVQVGGDVVVFSDTARNDGAAEDAIVLVGKGLNAIAQGNVVRYEKAIPPPVQPPSPPGGGRDGTLGADTLTANDAGEQLNGLAGGDRLLGGRGVDTLYGGDGADTLDGGSDANFIWGEAGNDVVFAGEGDAIALGSGADLIRINGSQFDEADGSRVLDWSPLEDGIRFFVEYGGYAEGTATSFAEARTLSTQLARNGYGVVSIQIGADVLVFGNSFDSVRGFDSFIRLVGRTLEDVAGANVGIFTSPAPPPAPPAGVPAAPVQSLSGSLSVAGSMDLLDLGRWTDAEVTDATLTRLGFQASGFSLTLTGSGFSTDSSQTVLFGSVTGLSLAQAGLQINGTIAAKPLGALINLVDGPSPNDAVFLMLSGSDRVTGSGSADVLKGFAGGDLLIGGGGGDTIWGGADNDVIYATAPGAGGAGATYLRGESGNDWISGADGFDDIHGNEGADTAAGGVGDDWVVGGKDADMLFGQAGADLVYGNIGRDTCDGGDGNDIVRGGQEGDLLYGGAGDDFLSGDKGDDTVTGGAGADSFHISPDSGTDRVLDFNAAEGDRVHLDPGTQYSVAQVGPDTIITLGGFGASKMTLIGVSMTSLPQGWIFGA